MKKISIDQKIVDYRVALSEKPSPTQEPVVDKAAPVRETSEDGKVVRMHEKLQRPEMLLGSTYKVKTPMSDHAMYVTINDIILNADTEYEIRRPFEIFINSKNLDHYQWIVALTRIMSAVFRKGGDVTFLVDELKAVFDPRGGTGNQVESICRLSSLNSDISLKSICAILECCQPIPWMKINRVLSTRNAANSWTGTGKRMPLPRAIFQPGLSFAANATQQQSSCWTVV